MEAKRGLGRPVEVGRRPIPKLARIPGMKPALREVDISEPMDGILEGEWEAMSPAYRTKLTTGAPLPGLGVQERWGSEKAQEENFEVVTPPMDRVRKPAFDVVVGAIPTMRRKNDPKVVAAAYERASLAFGGVSEDIFDQTLAMTLLKSALKAGGEPGEGERKAPKEVLLELRGMIGQMRIRVG